MKCSLLLIPLLVAAIALSLCTGDGAISLSVIRTALQDQTAEVSQIILWEVRVPRTAVAVLVGATLGMSGAAMQGFMRNPLAEPGILGISSGAALGAVLAFYAGLTGSVMLTLAGTGGALLIVLFMLALAGSAQRTDTLILAGIALSSLCSALIALTINLQPNPYALMDVMFWLMGSLANRSMEQVWLVLPAIVFGWFLLLWDRRTLAALSLGEETATSLGVTLTTARLRLVIGTALAIGASVAVSGVIGFVGLVVPHMIRPFVRHDPQALLVPSALGGAVLLLLADILVRIIPTNSSELKIGVVTAMVGVPFFLMLILRMRKEEV